MNQTAKTILGWLIGLGAAGLAIAFGLPWVLKMFGKNFNSLFSGKSEDEVKAEEAAAKNQIAQVQKIVDQNANQIGFGWNAQLPANTLFVAMDGWGTDEVKVFSTLESLNSTQVLAVFAAFGIKPYGWPWPVNLNLIGWLKKEFEGDELQRVLKPLADAGLNTQ